MLLANLDVLRRVPLRPQTHSEVAVLACGGPAASAQLCATKRFHLQAVASSAMSCGAGAESIMSCQAPYQASRFLDSCRQERDRILSKYAGFTHVQRVLLSVQRHGCKQWKWTCPFTIIFACCWTGFYCDDKL